MKLKPKLSGRLPRVDPEKAAMVLRTVAQVADKLADILEGKSRDKKGESQPENGPHNGNAGKTQRTGA